VLEFVQVVGPAGYVGLHRGRVRYVSGTGDWPAVLD
jgi:hypothetical protein